MKPINHTKGKGWVATLGVVAAFAAFQNTVDAEYVGSVSTVSPNSSVQSAAFEILGNGGGAGSFIYKGDGNAIDAAVAAALAACVVNPGNASLGGYGGHMLIYKSGFDGDPPLITCIDFNTEAGSLATSNMFAASVNPTNGHWTGTLPAANQTGWKSVGVPGTFAGLYMAQTNYGRKINGTNYFPFAEIMRPALARIANGQAAGTAYYTLTSVSNLLMELYTNSNPYAAFYSGGIALDIAAAMQANGSLVTYADMTNYRPREVTPYMRHFNPPNGTPATVYVAPPGSAGVSVLQELAMVESLGWTNGPGGTWDSLRYWHSRAEASRLMWKDHFQWIGDPWSGVLPPDFLGNGSTNFCDQLLGHVTNGYTNNCRWDLNEILLTNSLAESIIEAVDNQTNNPISVDWDDVRYGTRNITVSDKWGNCVALTFSMGNGFTSQAAVPSRGLVFGQGMALFDARPGWPDSIAPGKRPVNNMCPAIVIPDFPSLQTNGAIGGRAPFAVGGVGGSTIENNVAMMLVKYLTEPPSNPVSNPSVWMSNFEGNKIIYMRPSYPTGVQSYLGSVGFSAPGGPPSSGDVSYVQAWIPPVILTEPTSTNVSSDSAVTFEVTASGLPLFYQWFRNGIPLVDSATISGVQTPQLTLMSVTNGAAYSVVVSNGAANVTSATAAVSVNGAPVILTQPTNRINVPGTLATFSVSAAGSGPLIYKWLKNSVPLTNGGNVSGATTSTLSLANVSTVDAANYSVTITNLAGSVTSAAATLMLASTNPPSPPFLYEPFNYSNIGSPVSDNTPTNWTFGGSGANDLSVVNGNLSYPGLAAPMGNSVTNGGTGLGVRRLFGTNVSSGTLYFSALFRINDLGFGAWSGVSSYAGALCATDNTSFKLGVMIKSNSPSGYVYGVQKSGTGASTTFDTSQHFAGETVFLVGKYDFTVSPNLVSLWINPNPFTFGSASEPAGFISANTGTDGFVLDRFNMRQNAAAGSSSVPAAMQWDELRFGFSWAEVTPSAPYSSEPAKLSDFVQLANGTFQFAYSNSNGQTYNVFASTNLVDWASLGAATQTSLGVFQFTDLNATNIPYRFYQLRSP